MAQTKLAPVVEKTLRGGTLDTVASSASMANNTAVVGAAYNPTNSNYPFADWILNFTFGVAPTAGTAFSVYLLREDGSGNYETGSATGPIIPARNPDLVFPVEATATTQKVIRQGLIPPGPCEALIYNNGTGQTATVVSLQCLPYTRQGV